MIHSTPVTGKHLRKVLLIAAAVLLWCGSSFAAAISSVPGGGNWSAGATWVGGVVPTSADDVTIVGGATVTVGVGSGVATPGQCNSLIVNGTLSFGSGNTTIRQLNVTTNVTIGGTGTITVNAAGAAQHNFFIDGNLTRNGGTFTMLNGSGSVLVTFDGGGAQVIGGTSANITFNNVTINNVGGSIAAGGSITAITAATIIHSNGTFTPPANLNITGDFTRNGGTFTPGAGTVTFTGSAVQQINGGITSLTVNNLTVNKAGGSLTTGGGLSTISAAVFTLTAGSFTLPATFTASGNIILTAGTLTAGASLSVAGNFQKATAVTFVPGTGTVTFNGGGAQAINGTSATQTFNNIIINKGGGALTVGGGTGTVNANDVTMTAGSFTGAATFALAGNMTLNGGTFTSGTTTRVAGDWTNNGGGFTPGANTIQFNGAANQAINGTVGTQNFNDITINKAGGTLSVGGSTTTLNLQNFTNTAGNFDGPSTMAISGFVTLTSGTFAGGALTTVTGNWTNNGGTFIGGTGTVTFNAGVNQNINGSAVSQTFNNIIVNKGGASVLASAATLNVNDFTLSAGTFTSPPTFSASGDVVLTAGTFTAGTNVSVGGDWTKDAATFTPGAGTVFFNGSGPQVIAGTSATQTFNNFNVNKSGGALTVGGSTTTINAATLAMVAGSFTAPATLGITSAVTLTSGTLTGGTSITVGTNWTNNGGTFNGGTGTVNFNAGVGQQINGTATSQTFNNISINKAAGALTVGGSTTSVTANNVTLTLGTFTAPATLNVAGTYLQNAGTLTAGANMSIGGDWTRSGGVFTPGAGTVTFNGSGAQDINGTVATKTFTNLVINKSGGTVTTSGGTTAINATTITMTAGAFAAPATLALTGSATLNGGTLTAGASTTVGGNFTNNGGTFTPGTGTLTLNGAGAQLIDGTAISQSFNNLTINKAGGTVSSGGNVVTINTADLTETAGNFTAPATLNTTGNLLLTAGTFTAGSMINLGGNLTRNGGTFTVGTGTVNFNGTTQTIGGALAVTLFHATTTGTAAVNTAVATTIGGNLSVGNSTSFDVGGFNFSVAGTTTIGGGTLGTLSIALGGTKTFTGLVTVAATGTWNNSGSAPVTFRGGITANGTFSAGSSTQTFDTNVQILNGTLSIPTMDVVGITLINNGNLSSTVALNGVTGNLTQGTGATLTIGGTSTLGGLNASNSGNTVIYNGTTQTIFPTTFHNLTVNEAGASTASISGATRVNGVLALSSGNVSLGNNILTLGPASTAPAPVGIILASGGGEVRKEYSGTGTFTFPIGDNTGAVDSSPIQVNVTAGSFSGAYVSARVVNSKHPDNASAGNYLNRYWIVSQSGITGAVANITGTFVGTDVTGAATSAAGAYLSGTFSQTSNPWVKGVALTATTMSLTGVPLAAGVNTACTGITLAPPTVSITGGGVTVCAGTPVALGTSVSGDPTIVYSWTPLTGLSSSTIANPVATPLVTTPYTVTIRDGNGITNTAITTITINPTPDVLATPVSPIICTGLATNITLSNPNATPGTAYTWTVVQSGVTGATAQAAPIAGPIAQVLTASGAVPGTVTYSIVPVSGTCSGTPVNVVITVNPTPSVTAPANQAVCNTASTVAVNFSGTGTAYNWVNDTPSIGLLASGTGNIASFTATNAGATVVIATITVTPTYTFGAVTCSGTPKMFTITVNPTPTVGAVGNQVVCNGANTTAVTFTGAVAGTTYNWTNTNTSIGLAASGTGTIAVFAGVNAGIAPVAGTITVTPVFAGCTGTPQVFTITVNPTPNVADPADQVVCNTASTTTVTFTGTVGGTTYSWTNDTPSIGLLASGTGNITAFAATNAGTTPVVATIMVTPATAGPVCTGTPQTFTITVNPTPTVVAPANQVVCNGSSTTAVTFSGAVAGTTFNWTNNTPSIGLSASGTGNIGVFTGVNATGVPVMATITVTPVFATCVGTPQNFTITVNPTPTLTDPADQVVCNGANTTAVTFTGTAGATFSWTNDTPSIGLLASGTGNIGAFAAVNAGTTPITATITVTPATAGPVCVGTPQTFTITVNPTPSVTAPANQAVCNTASTVAVNFSGTGTAYNWVNDTPSIGLLASGTGNIASFTATNAGATVVIATITVTPTYTFGAVTCSGTPKVFTITVNPTPTVGAVGNQVVCNGANTTAVTFTGAVAGTTYNWTNTNTSIGLAASGTGTIAVFAGVNAGIAPVAGTITVTPVFAGCVGTPQVFTITVNPTPNVADPADQVVCNTASTTTVTFTGTVGGTTYSWTNDTPSIGLLASGTGNITAFAATNAGTTPIVATIMVTPATAGPVCTGTPQTFTITVNPTPTVVAPANQVVCNGSSTTGVTFSGAVAGTTFNWSNNTPSIGLSASGTGNIGVFTGVNATGVPVMATITVTPVFATCVGTPQNFTITVNPTPTLTDPADQVVCNGANTTAVTFTGTAGATFSWTNDTPSIGLLASGTGNIGAFAAVNAGTTPITATITVTPATAGPVCVGTPQTFTITVNPTPSVTAPANQAVCNTGSTVAVNFSGTGTAYNWVNDTPSIGLLASGTGNIASFTATNAGATVVIATITVTPTYTFGAVTCSGTPKVFTITVNPTPTVGAVGNQVVCNGANTTAVTFTGAVAGTTYNWTNTNTSIGLAASGTGTIAVFAGVNTGIAPVAGTITVTPVFAGCVGTPQVFTITVNPTPNVADPVDQVVCNTASTTTVTFTGTVGGTTYSWTNDTPSIGLLASGTGNITAFAATNAGTTPVVATIMVTPATAGPVCTGTPQTFTITVNPTPTVVAPANQVVCNGSSTTGVTFTGAVAGTTFNWTNNTPSIGLSASGTGNIGVFTGVNATGVPVMATITVTPVFATCVGTPQNFTITVNPTPTLTDPADQVVCNGANTTAVTFTGTAGATFSWTNDTPSIGLLASGTGNIGAFAAVNAGTTPITATIMVTPATAGPVCVGTPQTFTITVNPTPSVTAPANQAVCNTGSTVAVNFSGTGTAYNWVNDTPSIGLLASGTGNIASFTATNAGATVVIATITVTPTYTFGAVTCSGTPKVFTITVNPTPTVGAVGNQVVCNGANTTAVTFTGAVAGTTYNWTNTNTSIGLAASGTGTIAVFAGVNTGIAPVAGTITVTPVFAGCVGTPQVFTITVNPTPNVADPADQVVCNTASTTTVTFTGTVGGTTYSWTNDTPSIGLLASGTGNITAFAATNAGTTPIVATIMVTPATAGPVCTGTPQTFTITVNPTPTVVAPANQVVCNGSSTTGVTFTGAVAGTTFNWTNNTTSIGLAASGTGNIGVFTGVNATGVPVMATITVTPVFATCVGTPQNFTITVNPTPTLTDPADQVVCNGANTTAVTFTGTAGATFSWTNDTPSIGLLASGTGNIGAFAAVNAGTTPITATITVTPATAGPVCVGTPQTFTITVNPTPSVTAPANQAVCNTGSTVAVNFSGTGTAYNWVNDTPSIGLLASGTGNIASFTATNAGATVVIATITVTPTYTFGAVTCSGTPKVFTITVNPTPTVGAVGNQVVCNGANTTAVTFTGAVAGTTYNWTNTNTSIGLAASGTGTIAVFAGVNAGIAPVAGTITVTPVFAGCTGTPQVFTITVNPTPNVADPVDQVVCNTASTTTVTFTGTVGGTTYSWTNDTPSIGLLASGTGNITAFAATNAGTTPVVATIMVTPATAGPVCTGTPQTFTITVNPTPTVVAPANQVVCNGSSTTGVTFTGAVAGTTFNWTNNTPSIGLSASGTGNIGVFTGVNATGVPVMATITVTPVFATCVGTPQNFTITVNPTPTLTDPADQVVCNGANTTAVTFTGTAGATFSWTNDTPSIGLLASGTGNIGAFAAVNAGTTPITATIMVTPATAGPVCVGTPQTFTITVNPTPSVTAPANQAVCNTGSTVAVNFSGTGTAYNWVNDTPSIGLLASGTGNIASFTATNAGATVVIATITVTPTYTFGAVTCSGTPKVFTITVNPTPTVGAVGNQVVCNGANTTAVTFTGAVAGTTYNWTNTNTSIGLAASGTGTIAVFAGVNAGIAPVAGTITVTPVFAGCVGTPQVFTITVNPTPNVADPVDQVVCNTASTTTVTFTGTVGGTTYSWTNDTPSIGLLASGTGNITAFAATNAGTTPIVATIMVTPATAGPVCTGTPQTFTITVNPTPTVVAPANQVVCNGSSTTAVTFSGAVAGTTFNWTNNTPSIGLSASGTGNIGVFTGVNATGVPVMATITVTPVFATCVGTPQNFTITVNPTPTLTDPADQVVCNGANTTAVTFTGTAGATFSWTNDTPSIGLLASGTGNIGAFAAVNAGTTPITATITVTPATAGPVCVGTPQTFTITVNPTPSVTAPANQAVCNTGSTVAVNFSGTGTAYNWVNDTPSIGLLASGTGNIASFTATNAGATVVIATITVTPTYTFGAVTCSGTPKVFTITVNPTPTVGAVGNQVVCNGANTTAVTFTGAVAGTTYNWTNTNTSIGLAASGTGTIAVFAGVNAGIAPVAGTITVTPVFAGCTGTPQVFTITVNPTPNVADPVDQVVCNTASTTTVTFTGTVGGTTYSWTNDTPSIGLLASGTGNITAFAATNAGTTPIVATIMVTPATAGPVCTGTPQTFTITVNPTPTVVAPANQVVCNGSSTTGVTFTGAVAGTTFNWTNNTPSIGLSASGTGNIGVFTGVNATGVPVMATITVTPVFATCVGTPQNFTITVNPTPTLTDPADQVVCNGANTTAVTFTGTAGATFSWTNDTPSIGLLASGTGNIGAFAAVNAGTTPITATITVTPATAGPVCVGTPQTFTITVNPTPSVTAPANQAVCNTGSTVAVNFSGTGTAYNWVNDTPSIGLLASGTGNIASFTATNAGATVVIATITVTPTYTFGAVTCSGTPKVFTITVNPTPTVGAVGNQVVCTGTSTALVTFSGAVAGTTFNWTNNTPSIGLAPSGSGNIAAFTAFNASAAPVIATINVTPVFAGCTGTPKSFTITVDPNPVVTAGQTKTICSGQNVGYKVTLTPAGLPSGTTFSWAAPTMSDASVQGSTGTAVPESTSPTINDMLVNIGAIPITATYNIVPKNGSCTGTTVAVVITVNPVPVGVPVTSASCSDTAIGSAYVLTTTGGSVSAANFTIATNPNGLTQSAGTVSAGTLKGPNELIDDAWTNTTGADVIVLYTITPFSSAGCQGTNFTVSASIRPEPVSGPLTPAALCSDTPTGFNLSTPGAATYNISTNSNGLVQSAGTVSAGNGKLAAELADDQWTNTNNAFPSINVVYTITPLSGLGCAGNPFTVTVPVKPEPRGANATAIICSSISATPVNYNLQVTNINGLGNGMASTFAWSAPVDNINVSGESLAPQAGAVITDILVNPTGVDQVVTYQVTPTGSVSGCLGDLFTVTVTVKPSPIGVNQSVATCSDVSPSYNLLNNIAILGNNVGSTFSWVAASNANVTGESTSPVAGPRIMDVLNNLTNADEVVFYTVTPTGVNGCLGAPFTIQVTVHPEPVGSSIAAPDICSGSSVSYNLQSNVNANNALPASFLWMAAVDNPNVTGESMFTQTTVVISDVLINTTFVPQTVTYTVVPTSAASSCAGDPFTITVNVYPKAQVAAGRDIDVCSNVATVILEGVITFAPNGVTWTGGPGSYAPDNTVAMPVYTHTGNPPLDAVITQTLTLSANDPDGAGPCTVVTDVMTLKINGLPNINFSGLPVSYAENKPPIPLTGTQNGGNFSPGVGTALGSTSVNGSGFDEVIFDPSVAAVNQYDTIFYRWVDPATGCQGLRLQRVFVSPVTVIDFGMEYDCGTLGAPGTGCIPIAKNVGLGEFQFCANVGYIRLVGDPDAPSGDPAGTNFTAIGANAAVLAARILSSSNEWYIDTNGLPSDTYLIQYNYLDLATGNQSTPVVYPIRVWAAPTATIIAPANNCITSAVNLSSSSGMTSPNPFGGAIGATTWNFGDFPTPGTASGASVSYNYTSPGSYTVTLNVVTNNLCRDTDTFTLQVGSPPLVNFTWGAICTNDLTNYFDQTNPGISTIITYTWDFGDGYVLTGPAGGTVPGGTHSGLTTGTFKDPKHNFGATASYNTKLTVDTNDGCANSQTRSVAILTGGTSVAPTATTPYTTDFESGAGSWIAEGLVTQTFPSVVISPVSWIFGTPSGSSVNAAASGSKAWWTGDNILNNVQPTYYDLESSVVNGPCFDLTNLQRPMIEFDYWSDAEKNLDGAVLQYSINGGANWSLVGPSSGFSGVQRDQGINWYDPFAVIVSNPGQQVPTSAAAYGWTDKSGGWKRAKFNLDMVPAGISRQQVRIRIAFSSNNQNAPGNSFDGFAFDNVWLGEKSRRVLVENFTNSPAGPSNDQKWLNNRYLDQQALRGPAGSDFYYVNYHIGYPTPDPLNMENQADPGARSLFMGVSSTQTIIDGIVDDVKFTGAYTDLDLNGFEADRRALVNPQFTLVLDTVATGNQNTIKVKVSMTALQPSTDPLLVQVLLVEDQVGTFPYRNVVRKQLLGADGVTVSQVFAVNDIRVETGNEVKINAPITNPGMLTLIGYVQNKNTREIYQSAILTAPIKHGVVVTGLEDQPSLQPTTLNGITLYPNPANGKVFLGVPDSTPMEGFSWKLIDQRGIMVKSGDFAEVVNGAREISVSDLANGMYIMQLTGPGYSVVHRKLVVMNRN